VSADVTREREALFTLATGKSPNEAPEAWRKFFDGFTEFAKNYRNRALSDAQEAVCKYQPIPTEDMKPAYRRGFEDTRAACGLAVLELKS
jgi:hypothetical protein